jgi:hypothetical protein
MSSAAVDSRRSRSRFEPGRDATISTRWGGAGAADDAGVGAATVVGVDGGFEGLAAVEECDPASTASAAAAAPIKQASHPAAKALGLTGIPLEVGSDRITALESTANLIGDSCRNRPQTLPD